MPGPPTHPTLDADLQNLADELRALPRDALIERLREEVRRLDLGRRFTLLHELGIYHHEESLSGAGSTLEETASLRAALPGLFATHGVRSLLDLPCGDFHWMSTVDLDGIDYVGAEIVEGIVERNRELYGGPGVRFEVLDGTRDALPEVDLILCRDLAIHLALDDIRALLQNFVASGSRLLLITHFASCTDNADIESGDFRPVNLRLPPFGLPEPIQVISEDSRLEDGGFSDRQMALWSLAEVGEALDR